jgi:hypothetical protein
MAGIEVASAKGAGSIFTTKKLRLSNWSFIAAAFASSATTVMPASSGRCGCLYKIVSATNSFYGLIQIGCIR